MHDSQLSANCENGAKPAISANVFKAAPLNMECTNDGSNKEEIADPDTIGGTYNGTLIYPSKEN